MRNIRNRVQELAATNVLPSTSKPSATKKAVTTSRSATGEADVVEASYM